MSNSQPDSPRRPSNEDLLASSLPARLGSYRSLSARRPRDPSVRKSVSFNDVPIVHEVPSHDAMRNSNSDIYRSWTFTDTTSPISVISPVLFPLNSTSAAAQKIQANRLCSNLYSPLKSKPLKTIDDHSNTPLIVVHSANSETIEDKKPSYRSPILPDTDHYRCLPFTYVPLTESATTYSSMLSSNIIQANEQISPRRERARSATFSTIPSQSLSSNVRPNENVSIVPLRPTTASAASSRTVLKPATIAFHSSTSSSKSPRLNAQSRPTSSPKHHSSLTRSRSANVASLRKRQTNSPIVMLDEHLESSNLNHFYATTKRNPNVRQTYSTYYMQHAALLPTNIN